MLFVCHPKILHKHCFQFLKFFHLNLLFSFVFALLLIPCCNFFSDYFCFTQFGESFYFQNLDEIRDSAPLKSRLLPRRLLIFIFAPENTGSLYTRA